MSLLSRYFRLYGYFLRFSFSRAAEFRFDFLFRIFMDFIYYGVHVAFFEVLYRHSPTLGGWTQPQMNIFLGCVFMIDAIHMTLFSNNMWVLPMNINRGDFDYYLLRPVSPLFMATLRDVAINSAVNLVGAVAILAYFMAQAPLEFGVLRLFSFGLFVVLGVTLSLFLRLFFVLPVFWTQAPRGLENFYYSMHAIAERPDRMFGGWVRRILTTVLPFALLYSYPARVLVDEWSWQIFAHMVGLTTAFVLVTWICWRRCLFSYGSASS